MKAKKVEPTKDEPTKTEHVAALDDDTENFKDHAFSGMINHIEYGSDFTGIARSVQCYRNNGHPNFRILTLFLEKGKVVKTYYSDAYAQFEAMSKLELWTDRSLLNLNNNWKDGKAFSR